MVAKISTDLKKKTNSNVSIHRKLCECVNVKLLAHNLSLVHVM